MPHLHRAVARPSRLPRRLGSLAAAAVLTGCAHLAGPPGWNAVVLETASLTDPLAWRAGEGLPDRTVVLAGQLVVHADFPLAGQHRLIRDLETLRTDVSQTLSLPVSDEPVHLYLFGEPRRYDEFAARRFPNFPVRRAFFVETDTTLSVFAPWQDRIAEDLRHETAHGYLHAVVPTIPLWLDEGIAEYFELPRGEQGVHREHVAHLSARLLEGTWQMDLARLEPLTSPGEMSQDHYAEAWCWVHWLLHSTPARRRLLQDYLTDLRRDGATAPLAARLTHVEGSPLVCAAAVRRHLETLADREGSDTSATPPQRDPADGP